MAFRDKIKKIIDCANRRIYRFNNRLIRLSEKADEKHEQIIAGFKNVNGKLEPYGADEAVNFRDLTYVAAHCSPVVRYTRDLGKYMGAVGKRVAGTNIIIGGMTSTPDIHREIWKIEIELWATFESSFCFYEETDVFDYSSEIKLAKVCESLKKDSEYRRLGSHKYYYEMISCIANELGMPHDIATNKHYKSVKPGPRIDPKK